MQLSDRTILNEYSKGNIILEPFDIKNINPTSYDVKLGNEVSVLAIDAINDLSERKKACKIQLPHSTDLIINPKLKQKSYKWNFDDSITLLRNHVYLMPIKEKIGCKNNISIKLEGKSSYARLGLDIHVCGGHIETGFEGDLVLEVRPTYDIILYYGMNIAQLVFYRVEGKILKDYSQKENSKYQNQKGATESMSFLNFK